MPTFCANAMSKGLYNLGKKELEKKRSHSNRGVRGGRHGHDGHAWQERDTANHKKETGGSFEEWLFGGGGAGLSRGGGRTS